jgi:VWFA-related protein
MTKFGSVWGVSLAAILGLGMALLGAQQRDVGQASRPTSQPTFRATTRLVEVSVTVVDKKGNAVTGLGLDDFEVFDQGKARPVSICRYDGPAARTAADAAPAPLPSGTFTNLPAFEDNAPRQVAGLVLDAINTPPRQSIVARAQLMRYLRTLAPQTLTAVYLLADHLSVLHDFTDDAAELRARVENARLPVGTARESDERQAIVEAEMLLQVFGGDAAMAGVLGNALRADAMVKAVESRDRVQRSLAQIEALGLHLAGIPGRKSLVWIGSGFSMASVTATTIGVRPLPELLETHEEDVRTVSRRLAQQGVALYIVDANIVEAPSDTRAQSPQAMPQRGRGNFEAFADTAAVSADTKSAMQTMAAITGGRYFYPEDRTALGKVMADLQGSYTLGFYVSDTPDDKWHKLKVQMKRSGLSVRHREGYLAESRVAQPTQWTEEMWRSALSNPIASSAIPLTATFKRTSAGDVSVTVFADTAALQFNPDGENLKASLEVLIGDRLAAGPGRSSRSATTATATASQWETVRQQPTRYEGTWKPAADATGLRIIVHDVNSGRYGSLDVPMHKVPRDQPN